jgi:hypothetical protein
MVTRTSRFSDFFSQIEMKRATRVEEKVFNGKKNKNKKKLGEISIGTLDENKAHGGK